MHKTGGREDWSVEGPLEVAPDQEDNYAQEASAICVVGGSSGEPERDGWQGLTRVPTPRSTVGI
jgi:hypothetical protein